MATFEVGKAPWETEKQTFAVGSAPWETEQEQEPESDMGYIKRVASQFKQAGSDVVSAVTKGSQALQGGDLSIKSRLGATGQLLRTGLRTAGAVANTAFAPILEAPGIKQVTEAIAGGVTKIPGVQSIIQEGTKIAEKNPEVARDVRDIFDIVTLGTGSSVEKPVIKEIGAVGGDVVQGTKALLTPTEDMVQKKVVSLFEKSIKPTAKKTVSQGEKYQNDILKALKTINNNVDSLNIEDATGELITGRAPQSINELSQGLEQTKDIVFKQYDDLARQAGTSGAEINTSAVADELLKVSQNKALQLANPEVIKYAESWAERLKGMESLDTQTTQEVIKIMNNNLQAFYKNPSYDLASKVSIDAGIANNLRKSLDDAIEGATGKEYQALKNQYSSLKAIENDVVRASMRDARRNTKGLLDFSDMFTSGQMLTGILSLNPAMFTKGAVERGFKEYIKALNDPNRAIDNIFKTINKGVREDFVPTSETFKSLQSPSIGMAVKNVAKPSDIVERFTPEQLSLVRKASEAGVKTPVGANLTRINADQQAVIDMFKKMEVEYPNNPEGFDMFLRDLVDEAEKGGIYKKLPVKSD